MTTLITGRPQPKYDCSQAELYSGLNTAWNSQAEREAEFILENTKYTASLSVSKKAAIQAAKVLPDGQARYAESEILHADMKEQWDLCLGKWNSLDGYIGKAFKGPHYKPRIEEAGKGYYETAANKNWEDVSLLMEAGKTFINAHSAVLIADGGMPAGFVTAFDTVKDDFDELYSDFKDARQEAQEQTDAKIDANNVIYQEGREMMEDGKHIFRKNASVRERFIWEKILEMITPDGAVKVVKQLDVVAGEVGNFNMTGVDAERVLSAKFQATGSNGSFYGSPSAVGLPGPIFLAVADGESVVKVEEEIQTSLDINSINTFINVQNTGPENGHFKITFTMSPAE